MQAMRLNMSQYLVGVLLYGLLTGSAPSVEPAAGDSDTLDALERRLEMAQHEQLLRLRKAYPDRLAEFSSDGCSGGLSAGWSYLVSVIPTAGETHGDYPPWEACCIDHDRRYHIGGGKTADAPQSFDARKQADLALRSCVLATGQRRAPELTEAYGLSAEQIQALYLSIAALMYRAVRIGGVPCSGLPWRWGYGWPDCQ